MNEVYNNELYDLLIFTHETIIQGLSKTDLSKKSSVFCLLG